MVFLHQILNRFVPRKIILILTLGPETSLASVLSWIKCPGKLNAEEEDKTGERWKIDPGTSKS